MVKHWTYKNPYSLQSCHGTPYLGSDLSNTLLGGEKNFRYTWSHVHNFFVNVQFLVGNFHLIQPFFENNWRKNRPAYQRLRGHLGLKNHESEMTFIVFSDNILQPHVQATKMLPLHQKVKSDSKDPYRGISGPTKRTCVLQKLFEKRIL